MEGGAVSISGTSQPTLHGHGQAMAVDWMMPTGWRNRFCLSDIYSGLNEGS